MVTSNDYLMTFTLKIEDAVSLVPVMSAEQKLHAVQHWNVVSEKLQDIVNGSAADIGALSSDSTRNQNNPKECGDTVTSLPISTLISNDNHQSVNNTSKNNVMVDKSSTDSQIGGSHPHASRRPYSLAKKLADIKEKEANVGELKAVKAKNDRLCSKMTDCEKQPVEENANGDDDDDDDDDSSNDDDNDDNDYDDDDSNPSVGEENEKSPQTLENKDGDQYKQNLLQGKENQCSTDLSTLEIDDIIGKIVPDNQQMLCCPLCKFKAKKRSNLKAHYVNHLKPFACNQCEQSFSHKANLMVHERRHTGERPFGCSQCTAKFTTRGNLKRHEMTHTGSRPFTCDICAKSFTEKKTLKVHLRRHTGEKPYSCDLCDKSFSQLGILKSHMDRHINAKNFLCDLCGKKFRQKSQLRLHKLRHEGSKRYECPDCVMKFVTLGDMKRHSRVHTGERPFTCELCGKSFTRQQSLNEHNNRHYGRKPYSCKHCQKKFYEMSGCYKHMKSHKVHEDRKQSSRETFNSVTEEKQVGCQPADLIDSQQSGRIMEVPLSASEVPVHNFQSSPPMDDQIQKQIQECNNANSICHDVINTANNAGAAFVATDNDQYDAQVLQLDNLSNASRFLLLQMNDEVTNTHPVMNGSSTDPTNGLPHIVPHDDNQRDVSSSIVPVAGTNTNTAVEVIPSMIEFNMLPSAMNTG